MDTLSAERTDAKLLRFDQSGALLRKVTQTAAIGMALVGINGRVLYANRAYETMLGWEPDAVLGLLNADLLTAEDHELMNLRFAQLMRGEVEDFQGECRMDHRDGGPLWVLMTATLLRSETTTQPLYVIVQIVNIDRQKRAEAALAKSESLWNFALESAGQGVWDCDVPSNEIVYSRVWRKMRGIPEDEAIDPAQSAWLARVHPDDVERVLSASRSQGHGTDGFDTLEYRERHRNGHYIWILSRGRPVEWDESGNPIRSVGTDTDITRLKTAEAQVAEERERLRVTLDSIGEGVISTDAEGCVRFMNPVAEALTGWEKSQAIGRALAEVFATKHEATGASAQDVIADCLALGGPREIADDVMLVARNGNGRGVSGTASPVKDANGRTIGAVLVFKDVTNLQQAQRQLTHSANHDGLTDLPNRSALVRALSEAARAASSGEQTSALCFIDLDRFKPVNDTAGHAAGDELLKIVARVIDASCRAQDFAARLGGDEFVVLLEDCSTQNAEQVARNIVAAIAAIDFEWNGAHYSMGASVGVAAVGAGSADEALARADAACYAAKASGRGRVVAASV
ncbi:MAG: PAS domain S-box protein [Devosia sp.]